MQDERAQRRQSLRDDAVNLPNMLTFGRIIAIPLVLWLMWQDTRESNFWAMWVYAAAALTDFFDGYLARKMGLTSLLGKFLDPLADKLIVLATLTLMVELDRVPAWAVIVIASRELAVTALRALAIGEGVVIAASRGGKDKAALQMVAVLALILHDTYYMDFGLFAGAISLNSIGLVLLYLSVFFTVTSAGEYVALLVDAVQAKDRRMAEGADAED
ncbi:MAG: CDP-diacylglycerol--glycerol-3-phosphate 3-phosphatidyltransferase [Myxococcales bacterium]|nr:CDP-diacylglycerol--glycerol-3-phosphate 3-phosphatidyltransferase [Myxococcales bacterium]